MEPTRKSSPVADAIAEHLRDVNTQLRTITGLARRLSAARNAPEIEVVDAARRMRRFFADHWPLYQGDKEALATRLAGRDGALDALLTQLRDGLHEQQVLIERMKTLSATLEASPKRLLNHIDELSAITATLERSIDEHLGEEERLLHPLLTAHLSDAEARLLLDEISVRRGPPSMPFESIRL